MATFTCPRCGNSFQAKADLAVCDGRNVPANGAGEPVDPEGTVLPPGRMVRVIDLRPHRPVVMEREP